MTRYRNVCFTSFGDEPSFCDGMSYLIYGLEQCNSTKKWHWQGYVEFSRQVSRATIKQILGSAHFEPRAGTAEQAATYCAKEGEYCEYGTISSQGRRSDLKAVSESIVNGSTICDIAFSTPATFVQYGRGLSGLAGLVSRKKQKLWRDVRLEIWWGTTRTGKTRSFFSQFPLDEIHRFKYNINQDYWCGYEQQKYVLFDEFESQILLSNMLMYTDGHPLQLNTKFGHAYAHYEHVVIISNSNPQTFYHNCSKERRDAFAARVWRVIEYQSPDTRIHDYKFSFKNESIFVNNDLVL